MKHTYPTPKAAHADVTAAETFFQPYIDEAKDALPDHLHKVFMDSDVSMHLNTNQPDWRGNQKCNWFLKIKARPGVYGDTKIIMRKDGSIHSANLLTAMTLICERRLHSEVRINTMAEGSQMIQDLPQEVREYVRPTGHSGYFFVGFDEVGFNYRAKMPYECIADTLKVLLEAADEIRCTNPEGAQ